MSYEIFNHVRRYYGRPDNQNKYNIVLRLNHNNPIPKNWEYVIEIYDLRKKPGKQVINRYYGLTPEFFDQANRSDCFTHTEYPGVSFLTYIPEKDNHWKP
jgi:hypothetical protein